MDRKDRIVSAPAVLVGKPVVKGTRLSVEFLLGLKASEWTDQQILESCWLIARESIRSKKLPSAAHST